VSPIGEACLPYPAARVLTGERGSPRPAIQPQPPEPAKWRGDMIRTCLKDDGRVVEILRDGSERPRVPQVDWAKVDATTEEEIAAQIAEDEAVAIRDAAACVRRVRRKGGLSGR
jgi:hypothetical protein